MPRSVVFLGDSITAAAPWEEWYEDQRVSNQGINGDTTHGVLERLDAVTDFGPDQVLLLIGTNDLAHGVSPDVIVGNIWQIAKRLQESSANIAVTIHALLPRGRDFTDRVEAVNRGLAAAAEDLNVAFLDATEVLADSDGPLRRAFTYDDLHLNEAGYNAWMSFFRGTFRLDWA